MKRILIYSHLFLIFFNLLMSNPLFGEIIDTNDKKLYLSVSKSIEEDPNCTFQDEIKKVDLTSYYYFIKNTKKEKSFCDHIFLIYQAYTSHYFFDFDYAYVNAKKALEINEIRHSLPYIILGTEQLGIFRLEDRPENKINYLKGEKSLKKALELNTNFHHLAFEHLITLYSHLIEDRNNESEFYINQCLKYYFGLGEKKIEDKNIATLISKNFKKNNFGNNQMDKPFFCLYEKGRVLSEDDKKEKQLLAFEIFKALSDISSTWGHAEVAESFCEGLFNKTPNIIIGKSYLEKGISIGSYGAYLLKYDYLRRGACGYQMDEDEARKLIISAHETWNNTTTASHLADNFFFGYGGSTDKQYAIEVISKFAEAGDIDALSDLAYFYAYDSDDSYYDLDQSIKYLRKSLEDKYVQEEYLSYNRYLLAYNYMVNFFNNNNINPDDFYSNGNFPYINLKFKYFKNIDELNREVSKLYSKACLDGETAACEHAALIHFYGLNGIEANIDRSAFFGSKVFTDKDMEYTGFIHELIEENYKYTDLVKKYIDNPDLVLEKKQKWFIGLSASNYVSDSILNIPQAINDNLLMGEFFENLDYLSYWYDDISTDFYDNLTNTIEILLPQGELVSISKEPEDRDLVLFFSGHAIAYEGKNYILPIDVKSSFSSFEEARPSLISLDKLISKFSAFFQGTMIIIIDACRTISQPISNDSNNNFIFKSIDGNLIFNKSSHDGLAPIDAGPNKLIVFASEAGKPALFKIDMENSFFTEGLLQSFSIYPDDNIEELISLTRKIVSQKTDGLQTPVSYSTLINKYYLN